jgi:hypothetical protein
MLRYAQLSGAAKGKGWAGTRETIQPSFPLTVECNLLCIDRNKSSYYAVYRIKTE